jgi:hypothetical protein
MQLLETVIQSNPTTPQLPLDRSLLWRVKDLGSAEGKAG